MKLIIALTLALLMGVAQGQEFLNGKVVVAQGVCEENGKESPCLLVADPERKDIGWVVLLNREGRPSVVLELNLKSSKSKVVWDKKNQI
jgi:hypothetical protein